MPGPDEVVSHGRGGAANIGRDTQEYVDGGIVRVGAEGDQGDGPFSTGRGGQGNIGGTDSPRTVAADHDVVPEQATRIEKLESHHTGRGGAGNEAHVHKDRTEQHGFDQKHAGLGDKLKQKIMPDKN